MMSCISIQTDILYKHNKETLTKSQVVDFCFIFKQTKRVSFPCRGVIQHDWSVT